MPMPTPRENEPKPDFTDRCMGDEMMRRDFDDAAQRRAVCESQWDESKKRRGSSGASTGEPSNGSYLVHGGKTMRYAHIIRYVQETPWAILPSTLATILEILAYRVDGGTFTAEEIQERIGAVRAVPRASSDSKSIAVLPLLGVISQRQNLMMQTSGGTSTEAFTQAFRQAIADPSVGAIVIDVDSPGGTVNGVDELAAEIYKARGQKPIVAVANGLAASAAYWIASAAESLYIAPTGEVGSIGILAAHEDLSGELTRKGRAVTLISAGKYKTEGTPYGPLTDEAKAAIQDRVDDYYGMFTRAVAHQRGTNVENVRGGYGEGRVVGARKAMDIGMVDGISTLDEVIGRIIGQLAKPVVPTGALLGIVTDASSGPPMIAGPLPVHHTPTVDEAWDGPGNEARLRSGENEAYYRRAYAWQDPTMDPTVKAAYRFIHHQVSANGEPGAANVFACSTGIGILNGGRGGTTIPRQDRAGVHRHLAAHIEDGGRTAPDLQGRVDSQMELRRRRLRLAALGA